MARKQLDTWGGDVHLPRWLRRRHKAEPGDTPEKLDEGERALEPERSVLENADRAMGAMGLSGAMYRDQPDKKDHRHRP
jgi:hypothetical protein